MNGSGHVLVEIEREAGREAGSSSPVDLTNVAGQRKAGQVRACSPCWQWRCPSSRVACSIRQVNEGSASVRGVPRRSDNVMRSERWGLGLLAATFCRRAHACRVEDYASLASNTLTCTWQFNFSLQKRGQRQGLSTDGQSLE